MRLHTIGCQLVKIAQLIIIKTVDIRLRACPQPSIDQLTSEIAADLMKRKQQRILKNAFLRQQVIVLKRPAASLWPEPRRVIIRLITP
jgi:hypothetical protein